MQTLCELEPGLLVGLCAVERAQGCPIVCERNFVCGLLICKCWLTIFTACKTKFLGPPLCDVCFKNSVNCHEECLEEIELSDCGRDG